jgi:hypothetical protein
VDDALGPQADRLLGKSSLAFLDSPITVVHSEALSAPEIRRHVVHVTRGVRKAFVVHFRSTPAHGLKPDCAFSFDVKELAAEFEQHRVGSASLQELRARRLRRLGHDVIVNRHYGALCGRPARGHASGSSLTFDVIVASSYKTASAKVIAAPPLRTMSYVI